MMDDCVMFGDVVAQVVWGPLPIVAKNFCAMRQQSQWSLMYIDLSCLIMMLLVTTPRTVFLLVCFGVGGCLWHIFSYAYCAGIASMQLMKRAPNSASAAEDMTDFMICEMVRTDPFFGGTDESSDIKKCPFLCF